MICSGDHPFADDSMIDFRAAAEDPFGVGWSRSLSVCEEGGRWEGEGCDMSVDIRGGLSIVSAVHIWSRVGKTIKGFTRGIRMTRRGVE